MAKTAFLFPGQASQYVGMARDLYEASAAVRRLYACASERLGSDLAAICFEGPAEKLRQTIYTQPAVLVHSLAVLTVAGEALPEPGFAAGHSLGEYSALAAAGAISYENAIAAVCIRARLMEEACTVRPGTMAAVLSLAEETLAEVCKKASVKGIVTMANINSSQQVAISGDIAAVDEACRLAVEAGAKRAIRLEVGGAFHSPLMESASEPMRHSLDGVVLREAEFPVIANVTARPVTAAADIRRLLVAQITAPVRWRETMAFLAAEGVDNIFEIGPGKVLSGLAKREVPGAELHTIDTLADIESLKAGIISQG
jgi:[acyl-carrier-protein] S-malonyltransferase